MEPIKAPPRAEPKPLPPTIWPANLPPDIISFGQRAEETGQSNKGKLNIYTCNTCRAFIVTRDLDTGVTPFMTGCRQEGCQGWMQSSFYRVYDQAMRASLVWARPKAIIADLLKPHVLEHVLKGGLLLREPTEAEKEYC